MKKLRIYRKFVVLILLSASSTAFCRGEIDIQNARINAPPPGVEVTAGYMDIYNSGNKPAVLTNVSSPDFGNIEMHRSIIEEGIARMLRQDSVTIPSSSSLQFKPGDYHLMLFRPVKALKLGDTVTLNLLFSDNSTISVSAEVTKPGVEHMQHQHH